MRWFALVASVGVLTACGSSGSDSSGNGQGNPPPPTTYTLGGTVSGVSASGLVLIDNGTTLSVSSGATSFAFSTGLSAGTTYMVTVQSAPAGLTCTVANGSGTVGNANVTNIAVTCVPQTHSLGGTISGLSSSGLVLANSGATLTVNSGATTFVFPGAIATGTAYAVSVQSAPAGLTCSVANGSGTMGTADIANVVVTCSPQSYTLGGTITGLTVAGLVLANGTDQLNVPANASSFTLPTPVASTSSYTVTVATQPPGLSCAVANGSGTVGAANVTNITVACTDQSYTLGGTVTGLTTSGLVLTNGSDVLPVAANAPTFTFTNKVAFSAAYAVTVSSQPTGLTCSVNPSNASGTMPAGDVTNIAVVCAANSYTLGGTVGGLTVSGLTLANGTDTVVVPANATSFFFLTKVAYGASYAVTVAAQPNGWTCTVSAGSGHMPASNVVSVGVTCSINSYTLGGSISGLSGGGLVLTDTTDNLPVAANATMFTMPTALAYGSSFTVSVASQPIGMRCSVTGGTGFMGAGNVTSVQVNCVTTYWTWEGGAPTSTASAAAGNYAGPNPLLPAAREGQMAWTDASGHFWMFGGSYNGSELNDVWKLDPATNTWSLQSGVAPVAAPGSTGSYTAPYSPGGRHGGMVWTDSSGKLWLFGGLGLDSTGTDSYLNDLWSFNMTSGTWTLASPTHIVGNDFTGVVPGSSGLTAFGNGWPSGRGEAATWVDNNGRFWMYGGVTNGLTLLTDLWVYDPTLGEWALVSQNAPNSSGVTGTRGQAAGTNFPGSRFAAATWKDSGGRLWLFGGGGFDANPADAPDGLSDLWMLNPTTGQWTWEGGPTTTDDSGAYGTQYIAATGNWPSARGGVVSWVDASGNFWLFGGRASLAGNYLNDLWMYNPTTSQWAWVDGLPDTPGVVAGNYGTKGTAASTNRVGSRWLSSGWVDANGHLWLFGGNAVGSDGTLGDLNDLWQF